MDYPEKEAPHPSPLFDAVRDLYFEENLDLVRISFPVLADLIREFDEYTQLERKRGPVSSLTSDKQVIGYLAWLASSDPQKIIARLLGMSAEDLGKCIQLARPKLYHILAVHFSQLPPPVKIPDASFPFPEVSLLIDSTTVKIPRPVGQFGQNLKNFDYKSCGYGYKIEALSRELRKRPRQSELRRDHLLLPCQQHLLRRELLP